MPMTTADKRTNFRKMHESGCFVLPNPWDAGSARALQHLGFKAIASTSAGFAWSIGKADNRVTLEEVLQHLTMLCSAVDLPVNADFEGGFAHEPDKVAANVARAAKTGVAGLSIGIRHLQSGMNLSSTRCCGSACGRQIARDLMNLRGCEAVRFLFLAANKENCEQEGNSQQHKTR